MHYAYKLKCIQNDDDRERLIFALTPVNILNEIAARAKAGNVILALISKKREISFLSLRVNGHGQKSTALCYHYFEHTLKKGPLE